MLLDRSHKSWLLWTLLLFCLSTAIYWWYCGHEPGGARGGTRIGIAFGTVGYLLMVIELLLSARKKVGWLPYWFPGTPSLGRAATWLRCHIWFGVLCVPLIFYHAAFRWGGWLETLLMVLLAVVTLSGLFGLAVQQFLPAMMKISAPKQAIYEQLPEVCRRLAASADRAIIGVCGSIVDFSTANASAALSPDPSEKDRLRGFYLEVVRPYLASGETRHSVLANAGRASEIWTRQKRSLPDDFHGAIADLQSLCDERRQLGLQVRIQKWLQLWLFLHIPLSFALVLLGGLHAVMSLRY